MTTRGASSAPATDFDSLRGKLGIRLQIVYTPVMNLLFLLGIVFSRESVFAQYRFEPSLSILRKAPPTAVPFVIASLAKREG